MKTLAPTIRYIDYGIGFTVNDNNKRWIELNRNLNKFPSLKKEVLAHEMLHFNSKNKHVDFVTEFKDLTNFKHEWNLLKFSFKYPRAFLSASPFYYENRRWSINWFVFIISLAFIALTAITVGALA